MPGRQLPHRPLKAGQTKLDAGLEPPLGRVLPSQVARSLAGQLHAVEVDELPQIVAEPPEVQRWYLGGQVVRRSGGLDRKEIGIAAEPVNDRPARRIVGVEHDLQRLPPDELSSGGRGIEIGRWQRAVRFRGLEAHATSSGGPDARATSGAGEVGHIQLPVPDEALRPGRAADGQLHLARIEPHVPAEVQRGGQDAGQPGQVKPDLQVLPLA